MYRTNRRAIIQLPGFYYVWIRTSSTSGVTAFSQRHHQSLSFRHSLEDIIPCTSQRSPSGTLAPLFEAYRTNFLAISHGGRPVPRENGPYRHYTTLVSRPSRSIDFRDRSAVFTPPADGPASVSARTFCDFCFTHTSQGNADPILPREDPVL